MLECCHIGAEKQRDFLQKNSQKLHFLGKKTVIFAILGGVKNQFQQFIFQNCFRTYMDIFFVF